MGEGYFVKLPPTPPKPDVYLDQLEPIKESYPAWFSLWKPVINKSFQGKELMMRKRTYEKGIKISKAQMRTLTIVADTFHPEWNYAIKSRRPTPT